VIGHCVAVGPVGHRSGEEAFHRRLIVVGEVGVGLARRDRSGSDQRERRERAGMVERRDLGDHAADADPRQVRRRATQPIGQGCCVGGEVAQGVGGRVRVRGRRSAAVAQVVAHHAPPAGGEALAEGVGPGQHRGPAGEQGQWCVVVAEGLDAQGDLVGVDGGRRHGHGSSLVGDGSTSVVDHSDRSAPPISSVVVVGPRGRAPGRPRHEPAARAA
jgi:hypothetical protein